MARSKNTKNTDESRNWALIRSNDEISMKLYTRMWTQKFSEIGDTIVIFWHIPKCGGTSVTSAFVSEIPEEDVYVIRYHKAPLFATWTSLLKNENLQLIPGKLTFIEYHGFSEEYSFVKLAEEMKDIRSNVEAKGGHVFLSTILRQPLSAVKSYCNYVCYGMERRSGDACHPAIRSIENMQTRYLAYSYMPFISLAPTKLLGEKELLKSVITALETSADHIGFTENLDATFRTLQSFIKKYAPKNKVNLHRHSKVKHNVMDNFKSSIKFPDEMSLSNALSLDMVLYEYFLNKTSNPLIPHAGFSSRNLQGKVSEQYVWKPSNLLCILLLLVSILSLQCVQRWKRYR